MTPEKTSGERTGRSLASSFERYLQDKGKGRGGEGGNYRRNAARELERVAPWAAGAWLRRKQEEVLSAARELARRGSSVDPKENAVRARWDGRLRARVAGLSASEAEAVEAVLEAKVAIAPTEEVRKSAETQRRAVRIRRSSRSRQDKSKQDKSQLDLSEKQEEIAAYVAEIENWRSVRRDRPKSAEWRIRRHLKDVGEQEIEDLKGVLSERQRQVLEAQVQLIGVDPEVREEFGPGDAPSEWQREIYRQASREEERQEKHQEFGSKKIARAIIEELKFVQLEEAAEEVDTRDDLLDEAFDIRQEHEEICAELESHVEEIVVDG